MSKLTKAQKDAYDKKLKDNLALEKEESKQYSEYYGDEVN